MTSAASYVGRFAGVRGDLPGAGLPWLSALREDAISRLEETGFPDARSEAWKYTDLRRLLRQEFEFVPQSPDQAAADLAPWLPEQTRHRLVFINGRLAPAPSELGDLPEGVRLTSLAGSMADDPDGLEGLLADGMAELDGLVSLNTAFMADGAVLSLDPGTEIDAPLHLLFLTNAEAGHGLIQPRNLVVAGAGSSATLVETYAGVGEAAGWTNAVTDMVIGDGARLQHFKLQLESREACHTSLTRVELKRDSDYRAFLHATGGRLARNELVVRLAGDGASCQIDGPTLIGGRQHVDNTTVIEHAACHTTSRQRFHSVLDGNSRSVFKGRVLVEPDAQQTDAGQINRNLLLSNGAEADSKPELVIHADDVKCSHGATTGDLDRDALFYLRARGIDEATARAMLVEAFMAELVEGVIDPVLRTHISGHLAGNRERSAA